MMLSTLYKRYQSDERGNFAITFAIGATVVLGVIGASVDINMTYSSQTRAQNIADGIALNAAIYNKNTGEIPTGENASEHGLREGKHTAKDMGIEFSNFVVGGDEGVTIDIDYGDEINDWATVTVSGKMKSSFFRVLGKDTIDFSAVSQVAYSAVELNEVASIAFILDNSGSMAWDDVEAVYRNGRWETDTSGGSRLSALKTSMKAFMDDLEPLVGNQSKKEDKIVRTGMMAYNSNTISSRTSNMAWKLISDSQIDAMTAGGGTNSSNPMTTVATSKWILGEDKRHEKVNGKTPLKFVILMSDGVNNNSSSYWKDEKKTGEYRRTVEYNDGWGPRSYFEYSSNPSSLPNSWTRRVCGWYSCWNRTYTGQAWNEGRWVQPDDEDTIKACKKMKRKGVTIYTIGFALEPGRYGTNSNNSSGQENTTTISESAANQAYAMLSECASSPETFITATDGTELQTAFDQIGRDIVEEVVRIKS